MSYTIMGKAASAHTSGSKMSLKTIAILLIIIAAIGAAASFVLLQKSQGTRSDASQLACLNDTGTVTCSFEVEHNTSVSYSMIIRYVEDNGSGVQQTQTINLSQNQLLITPLSASQDVVKGSTKVPLKSTYSCDITVSPTEYGECNPSSASQTTVCLYSSAPSNTPIPTSTPIPSEEITLIPTGPLVETSPTTEPTLIPTVKPGDPTYTPTPIITEETTEPTNTPTIIPTVKPGDPTYTPTPEPTDTLIVDNNGNAAVTATTAPTTTTTTTTSKSLTSAPTATPVQSLPETGIIAQLSFVVLLSGLIIIVLGFVI